MKNTFESFWMGGFECSDQINYYKQRVNLLEETKHIELLESDYLLLSELNIHTVREGLQWSVVEYEPYRYNFDRLKAMMDIGRSVGIQQIWDLCHFGYPDDLSPLDHDFKNRFVSYCKAFGRFYVENFGQTELILTPINEVSFISWLGGDAAATVPFCEGKGWDVKYKLMEAYIAGIKALKGINENFKVLTTEPLVSIVPKLGADEHEVLAARESHEYQYQVLDILFGFKCPELGGGKDCVDFIGLNYYYNNQWINNSIEGLFLPWANEDADPRWRSLHSLMKEVYERYQYPIVLSETSHTGEDRSKWISHITEQCVHILRDSIPLLGICIYPIIDRPDWDHLDTWYHSGVWENYPSLANNRLLNVEYANEIRRCEKILSEITSGVVSDEVKEPAIIRMNKTA